MAVAPSQTSLAKLEPILLLAKSATGGGAAQLITQATSANGCYVFAELLEQKGIADLANSKDHSPSYRLLEIFSFGTLTDYQTSTIPLPSLNANQLTKLKQLTLVSLASNHSSLSYDTLLKQLDMKGNVRELEDLIIDTIYAGILQGRLNQMTGHFHVMGVMGRDVKGGVEIQEMVDKLRDWSNSTSQALSSLTSRISEIQKMQHKTSQDRRQHESELARNLAQVQSLNKNNAGGFSSNNGGAAAGASRNQSSSNLKGDAEMMDVDHSGEGSGANKSSGSGRKKTASSSSDKNQTRAKRSRGKD